MKSHFTLCLAAIFLVLSFNATQGQNKAAELADIEERLVPAVQKEFSNWTYTSIRPLLDSSDVLIDQWHGENTSVSVTIIRFSSNEEAQKNLQELTSHLKGVKSTSESGEEEYLIPSRGSTAYRKKNFTVNIVVRANGDQEQKIVKQITRLVSRAITKT
jgi:hypothetical protein